MSKKKASRKSAPRPAHRITPGAKAIRLPGEIDPIEFGARFQVARLQAGWSVLAAAHTLGVAPARIHEWEAGKIVPRVTAAVAAVVALGLDVAIVFPELFGGTENREE